MAINYNRGMSQRGEFVTPELATELLHRHYNPQVTVTAVRKLYGGNTNRVLEFILDREPGSVVAKVHDRNAAHRFTAEMASLRLLRETAHFPVPEPLACIEDDEGFDGSMLIMQKINGTTLESARINARGKAVFEAELGAAIAQLHRHKAERFGPATTEQKHEQWLDIYGPIVQRVIEQNRVALPSNAREVADHIAQHLSHWLDHKPKPTLLHGDLWANNILLDDAKPDHPRILAFIDGLANYGDPEYELANLQLFGTAGSTFYNVYSKVHTVDPGYRRRSRVYWLINLLQNSTRYGDKSIPYCEKLTKELRQLSR